MGLARKYSYELALLLIMIVAVLLRFYRLDYQSLWYDELYTVNEASPQVSWKQLFYYSQTDQHPPLYFILQRLSFVAFGYTEWTARALAALCGVLCVYGMYLLGREFGGKRPGLVAAAIICINQYSIRYSHDARPYTMVWLLTILSYLFFIRSVRTLRRTDIFVYVLFTTLLLYTSYFGFLALLSQAGIAIVVWLQQKSDKKRFFLTFLAAGVAVLLLYAPWYKYLLMQTGLKPFWLKDEPWNYLLIYYYAYFGGERYLIPFLVFAPMSYLYYLYRKKLFFPCLRQNTDYLGFLFILLSITIPFLVLYIRSVMVGPVLQMRYAVVALPGLFLLVALGINTIRSTSAVVIAVLIFMLLSSYNLVSRHQFYSYPTEMQYRQAAKYMAEGNRHHPVLNRVNGWQMKYYMNLNDYRGKLFMGKKDLVVDSILRRVPGYEVDTFWIVTGFLDEPLFPTSQKRLNQSYTKVRQRDFKGISVVLYGRVM